MGLFFMKVSWGCTTSRTSPGQRRSRIGGLSKSKLPGGQPQPLRVRYRRSPACPHTSLFPTSALPPGLWAKPTWVGQHAASTSASGCSSGSWGSAPRHWTWWCSDPVVRLAASSCPSSPSFSRRQKTCCCLLTDHFDVVPFAFSFN